HGDSQRSAAAANSDHGRDDRNFQARHLAQVVCDGLGLSPFFGMNSRVGAVSIHQGKNWPVEFLRDLHHAERFTVTLWMRRTEVAVHTLLHVPALLSADDQDFIAVKASHATDNCRIVAEGAV